MLGPPSYSSNAFRVGTLIRQLVGLAGFSFSLCFFHLSLNA